MLKNNLPDVKITDIELSDLFFNFVIYNGDNLELQARDFLDYLPSLELQGVTVKKLVENYNGRV